MTGGATGVLSILISSCGSATVCCCSSQRRSDARPRTKRNRIIVTPTFVCGKPTALCFVCFSACDLRHGNSSYSEAKACFYRSFNSIFGKIGRIAPENVTVLMIKTKCLPALLYGVEACPLPS